jgi:hypothetical protein
MKSIRKLQNIFLIFFTISNIYFSVGINIPQPPLNLQWNSYPFGATDVGVGSGGDIFIINTNGGLNYFHISDKISPLINATPYGYPLPLTSVDVDGNGTPFIVDISGNTLYLNCANNWKFLPGCAKDIGVGTNGEVWKIGCDEREGGYGVWKLVCNTCNFKNDCLKIKQGAQNLNFTVSMTQEQNCNWHRIEGGGVRIDVDPHGNPWVVTKNNEIYSYDGLDWHLTPNFSASDISVSNEGVVVATGTDFSIGRLICPKLGTWVFLSGSGTNLSIGPYSLPFVINSSGNLQALLN